MSHVLLPFPVLAETTWSYDRVLEHRGEQHHLFLGADGRRISVVFRDGGPVAMQFLKVPGDHPVWVSPEQTAKLAARIPARQLGRR